MYSFRPDEQTQNELEAISRLLGVNRSEAIAASIHEMYQKTQDRHRRENSFFDVMDRAGLIGCFDGSGDLSETYKDELKRDWEQKYSDDD